MIAILVFATSIVLDGVASELDMTPGVTNISFHDLLHGE